MWKIVAKRRTEPKAVIKHHGSMAAFKKHWAKLGRKDSSIRSLHREEAGPEGQSWSGSKWLKKESFNLAWRKRLRMGKAAGVDNIDGEMMKYGGKHVQDATWTLIKAIENKGVFPKEWNQGVVIPLHKAGNPQNPANYRGMTLLCNAAKVFEGAILVQLNIQAREQGWISDCHCGFRKGRGVMDQVWWLKKCLMKKSKERTYIALLGISKAYDMLDHDILARTLCKRGAEEAAMGIIAEWYHGMTSVIRMNGQLSEEFLVERGVKQGVVLSPFFFNVYINVVARKLRVAEERERGDKARPTVSWKGKQ